MWAARPIRGGASSSSWRAGGRSVGLAGDVGPAPSPATVFTMTTVQRALCEMRLGTLPSRNSLRPLIPALPTTRTSAPASSAARTMAVAGSASTTTRAEPRVPASCSARWVSSDAANEARVASACPASVPGVFWGSRTWMTSSSAP